MLYEKNLVLYMSKKYIVKFGYNKSEVIFISLNVPLFEINSLLYNFILFVISK